MGSGPGTGGRVLFVTHSYYVRDTRPRRHATALAEAGWDVEVLCARDEGEAKRERLGAVLIRRLPARRRRGSRARYAFEYGSFAAMAFGAMAWLHMRHRYDLVYVFSLPNILVRAAAVPKLRHARVVLDVRDPMPEFFRSKYGLAEDHRLIRALLKEERLACRYATHVVTVHDAMKDLLLRTGVPAERISVVMNAPDRAIFDSSSAASNREPDDRTILYAGTVAERYGVDLLVRAVARLKDVVPGIRVRVVGDGDLVPRLAALARELGVADRVALDGPVPLDAVPGIVRAAWVGAQPHPDDPLMRFSFSTKILEWCALGLPVICSRTEAFARAFDDRELTFVKPGDLDDLCRALLDAHRDAASLARRVAAAREAVGRFDWSRERRRLLSIAAGEGLGSARRSLG
jgi:glycosyltransferase involved in cell wall biosynthesis